MQQKVEKTYFVLQIIAFELVLLNCPYEEQDTFHQQPMCYQVVPRFYMSIRETFSNSNELAMISKYDTGGCDLNSAWARLLCCLSKGPLKRDFLGIYLTTFSD